MRLTATPPASAIGFSDRSPALNVLPGFQSPPPGYGIVPFYWWLGDPITKERLGRKSFRNTGLFDVKLADFEVAAIF